MWMEGNTDWHSSASCSMFVCLVFPLFVCVFWSCIVEVENKLCKKSHCANIAFVSVYSSGGWLGPVAEQTRKLDYSSTHTAQHKLSGYTSQQGRKPEPVVRFNRSNSGVTFSQVVIPRVNVYHLWKSDPPSSQTCPLNQQCFHRDEETALTYHPCCTVTHSPVFPNRSAVQNTHLSVRSLFRTLPGNIASTTCDWN